MLYDLSMVAAVLVTKLYIPPPPSKVVVRTRLIERFNGGLSEGGKLILISAPAGFGKSTLVSEWIAGCGRKTAWLSLDESDNDPSRFLIYVISALQTIAPNLGAGLLNLLQSRQAPPVESILTALLNEIATIADDFILVLDDYHLIESGPIDHALTFLLEHMPPQMRLVITTREDPQLPLARLRARNQLTELRASDLRFTPAEVDGFLQLMNLHLSAEDVAVLDDRTEGWITGLQLATLSMRGHQDVAGFIRAFAGNNRYLVDYLIEEVLQRQPESVCSFLLQTAILDRLTGSLCDAVTGQPGGRARLETLQRGNFFLIPLDDRGEWYRYHHLFADVLHMHLMVDQPDQVGMLHRRASVWFEQNGSTADAIRHALAGQDFERAADLIEREAPALRRSRQEMVLLSWFKAIPDEVFQCRPVLSGLYGGVLLQTGQLEQVEDRLRDAERLLDKPAERIIVNEEEFQRLPGSIAVHRAGLALLLQDVASTVKHARLVLDLVPEDDHLGRGAAAALLGLASWTSGDLEEARRSYADGMARLLKAGNTSDVLGCSIALADILMGQGRLREAARTYERGLQLGTEQGDLVLRGTADMHVGMSVLYRERDDLTAAKQHLWKSKQLGEFTELSQNPYRWRVAMASIRQAEGDLDGALVLLNEAEHVYAGDFSPNVHPIAAMKARVWAAQGRLGEAFDWARAQGLSPADDLSYLREFEHITLVRILLARCQRDPADCSMSEVMGLLERLLRAAQDGKRIGSEIEILVLQALAQQMQTDIPAALAPLERALTLAEPEGYMRMFLDEGPPMAQLLRKAAARGITPDYTARLLAGFEAGQQTNAVEFPFPDLGQATSGTEALIEPLSQRELDVLRLFKTDLSGPEIAHELMIALSTVRTHTKSIYSKLDVNNRRAAVKRASELGLM